MAEKAEYDHGQRRGEDDAEQDAGQTEIDQSDDHILCSDQHGARPAVQRAPQLHRGVSGFAPSVRVRRRHHDP